MNKKDKNWFFGMFFITWAGIFLLQGGLLNTFASIFFVFLGAYSYWRSI